MTRRKDATPDASAEAVTGSDLPPADAVVEGVPETQVPETDVPETPIHDAPIPQASFVPPPEVPAEPARSTGVLGPLLGGALAAAAGFGLAHFNVFGLAAPDQSAEITALGQRLDAAEAALEDGQTGLQQGLDGLAGRVATLESAPGANVEDLDQRLAALEARPVGEGASTAAVEAKLAELEQRLAAIPEGRVATAEVDAALARLAEVEAEAQARAAEAAALAEAAAQAQALEVLAAAVATGGAFEAELAAVSNADLQAALASHVAGVVSLAELQADFPDAARAALQVARANDSEAGWGERLVDFLGAQTGARSLTPREGDDPDAILSRAEFALGEGRLSDALTELEALEPVVRVPLEGWMANAKDRVAVDAALAEAS
jgi:hypothetical protein